MGDNSEDGSFLTGDWQNAMCVKVRHALKFCTHSPDETVFLVSDVDVQFFSAFSTEKFLSYFESLSCEVAFQKERYRAGDTEMCCGFYVARNTPRFRRLLATALGRLEVEDVKNEQVVINRLLKEGHVTYAPLDGRFYARSHGFPPPRDIWIHHANWTDNVALKRRQLDRVAKIVHGSLWRTYFESFLECIPKTSTKLGGSSLCQGVQSFLRNLPLSERCLP